MGLRKHLIKWMLNMIEWLLLLATQLKDNYTMNKT